MGGMGGMGGNLAPEYARRKNDSCNFQLLEPSQNAQQWQTRRRMTVCTTTAHVVAAYCYYIHLISGEKQATNRLLFQFLALRLFLRWLKK